MRKLPQHRAPASLTPIYLAIVVLGSIVAHLASEFFAMGSEAGAVALSPRHLYLGVTAVICAGIAIWQIGALWRASAGGRDLKRALHVGLERLPFRGRRGWLVLTVGLQLGISLATQYGEGCPLCGHDVAAGIVGALVTVIALALIARAIGRRLPSIAAAIADLFLDPLPDSQERVLARAIATQHLVRFTWFSQLYNRPPPLLQD